MTDDTVLEEHYENPDTVQMRILGEGGDDNLDDDDDDDDDDNEDDGRPKQSTVISPKNMRSSITIRRKSIGINEHFSRLPKGRHVAISQKAMRKGFMLYESAKCHRSIPAISCTCNLSTSSVRTLVMKWSTDRKYQLADC